MGWMTGRPDVAGGAACAIAPADHGPPASSTKAASTPIVLGRPRRPRTRVASRLPRAAPIPLPLVTSSSKRARLMADVQLHAVPVVHRVERLEIAGDQVL